MEVDVITIFPEMFAGYLNASIISRAQDAGKLKVEVHNLRDYACGKRRITDDRPYGGGAGMVMKPEPIFAAVDSIKEARGEEVGRVILPSPQGKLFDQKLAEELSKEGHLIFICSRYEGVDERVRDALVTDEVSIGDYIITGGELAAMVVIDAVARMLPGVLGNEGSLEVDSFSTGLLEYPQYTRPPSFREMRVPSVLLSGDHEKIDVWRREEMLKRTCERRPDLLKKVKISDADRKVLDKMKQRRKR